MKYPDAGKALLAATDERMILILDQNGHILWANEHWEDHFQADSDCKDFEHWVLESDRTTFKDLLGTVSSGEVQKKKAFIGLIHPVEAVKTYEANLIKEEDQLFLIAHDRTHISQENKSKKILANLGKIGMWSFANASRTLKCSEGMFTIYGFPSEIPLDNELIFGCYKKEDSLRFQTKMSQLLSGSNEPLEFIGEMTCGSGVNKTLRTRAQAVFHEGEVVEIQGYTADISLMRRKREAHKFWLEMSQLALKGIKSGVFFHDLLSDEVVYGEEFKEMIGLGDTAGTISEEQFREMIVEEDRAAAFQRHQNELKKKSPYYRNDYRLKHGSGEEVHYEVYAWKQFDENQEPIRMVGNLINVEEEVKAKKERQKMLRSLKAVVNNGFTFTYLIDHDGYILYCDQRSAELIEHEFGVNPFRSQIKFESVTPKNLQRGFNSSFPKALNGQTISKVVPRYLIDGSTAWMSVRYAPVPRNGDDEPRVLLTILDITEQKRSEQVSSFYQQKLEELAKLKHLLLENAGESLSAPLDEIKSVLHSIKEEGHQKVKNSKLNQALELLEGVRAQEKRFRKEQILKAERASLSFEKISLEGYVKFSIEKQEHFATTFGVNIDFVSKLDSGLTVLSDLGLLQQVIDNTLNNSIHYTKGKTLSLLLQEHSEGFVEMHIHEQSKVQLDQFEAVREEQLANHQRVMEERKSSFEVCEIGMELMKGTMKVESSCESGVNILLHFPKAT
jgi:two-component system cell cycle sensor histidine kinase PleC